MMTVQHSLASLLDSHMKKASIGEARLAKNVNTISDNPYFIHRSTIRNWRIGSAKNVNSWRQLAAIAVALGLGETEASELLESGGCPSIRALKASESDQALLAYWQMDLVKPTEITRPLGDIENNHLQPPTAGKSEVHKKSIVENSFFEPKFKGLKLAGVIVLGIVCFSTIYVIMFTDYFQSQSNNESAAQRNLLVNSHFDEGKSGWITYVNDAADADFKVENGAIHIQVDQTTGKGWHIALNQKNLVVSAGKTYTARFRIRGDSKSSMHVDLTRVVNPKTSLSFDNSARQKITTTDNWAVKTIVFEAIETITLKEGGARLLFKFGKSERGWIELDDIEFFESKIEHDVNDISAQINKWQNQRLPGFWFI